MIAPASAAPEISRRAGSGLKARRPHDPTASPRPHRDRRRRARGPPPNRPWPRPHARLHARRHRRPPSRRMTADAVRADRRRDHPRQRLSPHAPPRRRAHRAPSAACIASWTGPAPSSPIPAASRSSRSAPCAKSTEERRGLPLAHRRRAPQPHARALRSASSTWLDATITMVLDECTPVPRRHFPPPASPWSARCAGPRAPSRPIEPAPGLRRSSASSRAASIPSSACAPPPPSPTSASTATRSAASPSAKARRACSPCST